MLHLGTSGWSYPHWKGISYPQEVRPAQRRACYAEFSLLGAHGCDDCTRGAPALPCHPVCSGGFLHVRRHGAAPQFGGSYPDDGLAWWVDRVWEPGAPQHDTYVCFSNDLQGYAVRNAQRMLSLLAER